MENPGTWGPIHKAINMADRGSTIRERAESVLNVLQETKPNITIEQVIAVYERQKKQMEDRICGLSLCSMIVNELMT